MVKISLWQNMLAVSPTMPRVILTNEALEFRKLILTNTEKLDLQPYYVTEYCRHNAAARKLAKAFKKSKMFPRKAFWYAKKKFRF